MHCLIRCPSAVARALVALAVVASCVGLASPAAHAHSPHDVINIIAVAPDFPSDGTIFASCVFTRHRLFVRSTDGGRSWQVLGRPFADENPSCFVFSPTYAGDGTTFCGTKEGGVWRTTDRGDTWSLVLPAQEVWDLAISPDFDVDQTIVAATPLGAMRSIDGGDSWAPSNTGLSETVLTVSRYGADGTLWAGGKTVHRSTDGGASWTPATTFPQRMATLVPSPADPTGSTLAAGFGRAELGVWLSFDAGMSFAAANAGLTDLDVDRLDYASDGTLFALADGTGVFRLDAFAGMWITSDVGLEPPSAQSSVHFRGLAVSPGYATDGTLLLATFEGCYLSTDGGTQWTELNLYDLRTNRVLELSPEFATDGRVFLGNYGSGVILGRTVELSPGVAPQPLPGGPSGGGSVLAPGGPLTPAASAPFAPAPARVPAAIEGSDEPPDLLAPHPPAWRAEGDGMVTTFIASLAISPDFAHDRTLWAGHLSLYRSHDAGLAWERLPQPAGVSVWRVVAPSPTFASDGMLLAGTDHAGTWRSDDAGESWNLVTGGLPGDEAVTRVEFSPDFAVDGRIWLSTVDAGLWRSTDGGATWTALGLAGAEIRWLEVTSGTALFAGTVGQGLFRSTDGGDTLLPANDGLPVGGVIVIESISASPDFPADGTAFLVSLYDGVYKTVNGGVSWSPASTGLSLDAPRVIAVSPAFGDDQTVLLTTHAGVWRSLDAGGTWERLPGLAHADDGHQTVVHAGTWSSDAALLEAPGNDAAGAVPARVAPPPPHPTEPGTPSGYAPKSFCFGTTSSEMANDTIRFAFVGDAVEWYVLRDHHSGIAEVSVDGGPPVSVDLYAPSPQYRQRAFVRHFGTSGPHVVDVTVTGTRGPFSEGTAVHDDGFTYTY